MPLVLMPKKKVSQIDFDEVKSLAQQLNIDELTAQILSNRGFDTKEKCADFLFSEELYNPFEILNMDKLVEEINRIKEKDGTITVFGDYDVDGTSAVAILTTALTRYGVKNNYYIPNRKNEGYGLNENAVFDIFKNSQLIITVDCGITSTELIDKVISSGKKIIVTDHHTIGEKIPNCLVVKPGQPGDTYKNPDLSGAGIAFKIAQALIGDNAEDLIEYAAVATVADVVPLKSENRSIVKIGLRKLNTNPKKCFKKLLQKADFKDEVTSRTIGFVIGPRMNAAGRVADANITVHFLLEENEEKLDALADELCRLNQIRQDSEKAITEVAEKTVEEEQLAKKYKAIVVGGEDWDEGVIGICAARICEKYKRPAIIFSINKESGIAKGSGRSVEGIDLYELLSSAKDILIQFGGHKMAAGMSIEASKLDFFAQRLDETIRNEFDLKVLYPQISYDAKAKISQLNMDFCKKIQLFQPFGCGNGEVTLRIDNAKCDNIKTMGADNKHLRLNLQDDSGNASAVAFYYENNNCDYFHPVKCSAIVRPEINTWKSTSSVSLKIADIKEIDVVNPNDNIEEFTANFYSRLSYIKDNSATVNFFDNVQDLAYEISQWDDEDISGMVILCDHPTYASECVQICKEEFPRFDISMYNPLNKINGYNSLVLCPNIENINFKPYKRIVIFDLLNQGYADLLHKMSPDAEIYALKCNLSLFNDIFEEYKQFSRENMLLAYKAISECEGVFGNRNNAVKQISEHKQISMPLISVALDVFKELEFLSFGEDFEIRISKNPVKRKLEESRFYNNLLLCINNKA